MSKIYPEKIETATGFIISRYIDLCDRYNIIPGDKKFMYKLERIIKSELGRIEDA